MRFSTITARVTKTMGTMNIPSPRVWRTGFQFQATRMTMRRRVRILNPHFTFAGVCVGLVPGVVVILAQLLEAALLEHAELLRPLLFRFSDCMRFG